MSIFTYDAALNFLNQLPKFSPTHSLLPLIETLSALGNPQNHIKTIHVAGTNGKGSTCTYIQEVLQASGYKVGLYFSPFIVEERESLLIQNKVIPKALFTQYVHRLYDLHQARITQNLPVMTHFESLTAIAYLYFYEQQVDFAVIEVGLGGLNDATNVLAAPTLCVITTIALDHTDFLGHTLEAIATAKSGIIKKNCPIVLGKNDADVIHLISNTATLLNAPITLSHTDKTQLTLSHITLRNMRFIYESAHWGSLNLATTLVGAHQMDNIACALTAIWVLKESGQLDTSLAKIQQGILNASWPCRTEFLETPSTNYFLDGAHNPHGIEALCHLFNQVQPVSPQKGDGSVLIFGVFKDKNYSPMLIALSTFFDTIVVVEPPNPRALSLPLLTTCASNYFAHVIPASSPSKALELSKEATFAEGMVFVAGSLNLVGILRDEIIKSIANLASEQV